MSQIPNMFYTHTFSPRSHLTVVLTGPIPYFEWVVQNRGPSVSLGQENTALEPASCRRPRRPSALRLARPRPDAGVDGSGRQWCCPGGADAAQRGGGGAAHVGLWGLRWHWLFRWGVGCRGGRVMEVMEDR